MDSFLTERCRKMVLLVTHANATFAERKATFG